MENEATIKKQIKKYEKESESLNISFLDRKALLKNVNKYADDFTNQLSTSKAYEVEGHNKEKRDEDLEITGQSNTIQELLNLLEERVDKPGLNPQSGGHLGYIPGSGLYASALGDYIAAITNRYAGVFYSSPGAVRLENALIQWVGKLIGFKGEFGGNLTSGGSYANMIGIATARNFAKIKSKDVERTVVYFCQQAHHSILKALKITGLEDCVIRVIKMDENYRMDMNDLEMQIEKDKNEDLRPFLLFANAGSTDIGAVDPLKKMATIAHKNKMWFHVDAAYGGFFLLTKEGRKVLNGIELADSVIMDPHKSLFVPYGLGMLMVKEVHHLLEAFSFDANYLQDTKGKELEYSSYQLSPELSKHFRGLRMWLPLKLHGVKPFVASLEEKILLTQYFYLKVRELGFKTGPSPDLSIVLFWYEPAKGDANEFNKKILDTIQNEGSIYISSTMLENRFLLRFAVLSFRTHIEQVDSFLDQLKNCIE
jgi:glutamate/tyrosine decarboxylase-like PLP-dependent enzyme